MAISVEGGTKFHRETTDIQIAVYLAPLLQGEGVFHINISLNKSPKVHILTNDISLDRCTFTDNYSSLGNNLSLKYTIYTDVVWRSNFTFDDSTS